jgi:hypothetical protein
MKRTYITQEEIAEHRARDGFVDVSRYAAMIPEDGEIGSIAEKNDQSERVCVERIFVQ